MSTYISTLFFFELLKNACITSLSKAGPDQKPEPIQASVIAGTSLVAENERSVKITDVGEGIRREDRMKVWSYFYSTRQAARLRDHDTPHRIEMESPCSFSSVSDVGDVVATSMSSSQANDSDGDSDAEAEPPPQEKRQAARRPRSDAADLVRGQPCPPLLSSIDAPDNLSRMGAEEEPQQSGPQQGHGLGLPVSRVLTRYFDGEIEINSLPRKGTDVYVYL